MRDARETEDAIARLLHADWCSTGRCYWLPAEPGPIRCDTIVDVVREFRDLCDRADQAYRDAARAGAPTPEGP